MEIRFKKISNELKEVYERVTQNFIKKRDFEKEMSALDSRNKEHFLSKSDFKKNWTTV